MAAGVIGTDVDPSRIATALRMASISASTPGMGI